MTEKEYYKRATLVALLVGSILVWMLLALTAVWHVQHADIGLALLFAILSVAPAAVAYEVLRRWNRG